MDIVEFIHLSLTMASDELRSQHAVVLHKAFGIRERSPWFATGNATGSGMCL